MAMSKLQQTAHSDGVASADRLRVTLIGDRDRSVEAAFDARHRVNCLRAVSSMEPIADQQPDLVVVGQPGPTDAEALTAWELVALARAHRDLREVPIILVVPSVVELMTDAGRLAEFPDVHVLAAPPDPEVIRSVVRSLERSRR
jgi:hypothetical protein